MTFKESGTTGSPTTKPPIKGPGACCGTDALGLRLRGDVRQQDSPVQTTRRVVCGIRDCRAARGAFPVGGEPRGLQVLTEMVRTLPMRTHMLRPPGHASVTCTDSSGRDCLDEVRPA